MLKMNFRPITKREQISIKELRSETFNQIDMEYMDNHNIHSDTHVKYYMFDFDDNLLHMDSKSYLYKDGVMYSFTTNEYATIGKNKDLLSTYSFSEKSFHEFRDNDCFRKDFITAITNKKIGKSWNAFISCILKANIFAIITNRGHDLYLMRDAIKWIISNVFGESEQEIFIKNLEKFTNIIDTSFPNDLNSCIDYYLDLCDIYCINSIYFLAKTGMTLYEDSNPSKKVRAVEMFAEKVHNLSKLINKKAKLGFSDDDNRNIEAIRDYMKIDLSNRYENISLVIYKTGEEYIKEKI
jgi:hypothetical protein